MDQSRVEEISENWSWALGLRRVRAPVYTAWRWRDYVWRRYVL